jgi:hypothetical protein
LKEILIPPSFGFFSPPNRNSSGNFLVVVELIIKKGIGKGRERNGKGGEKKRERERKREKGTGDSQKR